MLKSKFEGRSVTKRNLTIS